MNPLALEVWIYWLVAYIVVSITLYVVAKFSPYEWEDQNSGKLLNLQNQEIVPLNLNRFTLSNSFWFTIGSLMQQGSDINPKVYDIPNKYKKQITILYYFIQLRVEVFLQNI